MKLWKVLLVSGTLVGIFHLAADVQDLPSALTGWQSWTAMINQNTALWTFSIFAACYIIWFDVRPDVVALVSRSVDVRFVQVSRSISGNKKMSSAVFKITNSSKKTVFGVSALFAPWKNGAATGNDYAVLMSKAKYSFIDLNPSDSETLHCAHCRSENGKSVISVGEIDVGNTQNFTRDTIGELRVKWIDGGPIVIYVALKISSDGFMVCDVINKNQAKALSTVIQSS